MSKNQTFAAGLVGAIDKGPDTTAKVSRLGVGVLASRGNRLADLAAGNVVTRTQELVDPARCRMWRGHNRDYSALNEERCHDLIESLRAQGRQEVPALVRRVQDDPDIDFEVVCGARRHWSVSWLRAHNYPEFRFLVEVRDLTDEEAFRLGDLENRARDDISDLERARDYLRALDQYYGGRQDQMAKRLSVTTTWLSRYLGLARLPLEVVAAFADPHQLGIRHSMELGPVLRDETRRDRVMIEALRLTEDRERGGGGGLLAADTVRRLLAAANGPAIKSAPKRSGSGGEVIAEHGGKPLLTLEKRGRGAYQLHLARGTAASREDVQLAFNRLLDRYWG